MVKYAVVRKELGVVYYDWFKELVEAIKKCDELFAKRIQAGVVLSDEFRQEFRFGNALQENRQARMKKGYLLYVGGSK